MTKTRQLCAFTLYLTLAAPLATSCAREANTLEGDDTLAGGGSGSSHAGSSGKGGTISGAFGGTSTSGGGSHAGSSSKAGSASEGGDASEVPGAGGDGTPSGGAGKGGSAGGGGGAGGGSQVSPEVLARASAIVYYQTSHGSASDKTIQMKLFIKNQSPDPLPMDHVKIRYWFTAEVPATLHQYYTGPQAQSPQAVFVDDAANSHALMTFGGGSIVQGGDINASEIQLEITNDASPFDQSDDFSFEPSSSTSTPNAKITLYLDDTLIWGCEPSGACFDDGAGGAGGSNDGAGGAP